MTGAVVLVGMPGAGKTTFLAAAYQSLEHDDPTSPVGLDHLPQHRAYLREIVESWLAGQPVTRNRIGTGELIELDLRTTRGPVELRVPDVAGESFKSMVLERTADQTLVEMVTSANGVLLFVHPDHVRPRVSVAEANALRQLAGDDPPDASDEREFDIEAIADQIAPIDLLQWVVGLRTPQRTRVVVAISAWDTVEAEGSQPRVWLAKMLPLLAQYLDANDHLLEARIIGVSAQGGDYQTNQDLSAVRPTERPIVVNHAGETTSDLIEPLIWAAYG